MKKYITLFVALCVFWIIPMMIQNDLNIVMASIVILAIVVAFIALTAFTLRSILEIYNERLISQDVKKYSKQDHKLNLYSWSGEDLSLDGIMYDLFKNEASTDDLISNFRIMKEKLKLKIGHNREDYVLLLKYINYSEKNNFISFLKKASLAVGTFIVGKIVLFDKMLAFLGIGSTESKKDNAEKVNVSKEKGLNAGQQFVQENLETMLPFMQYGLLLLFFVFITGYIYLTFSKTRNRTHLVKCVVETAIEEMDNQNQMDVVIRDSRGK